MLTRKVGVPTVSQRIFLAVMVMVAWAVAPAWAGEGGGFAGAGLTGSYFANADCKGEPAFIRQDVRVDFDWGKLRGVGGSRTPAYRDFPREQFSVRWDGRIIPRYSEPYTFIVTADQGAQLTLQGGDDAKPRTLIDSHQSVATRSSPVDLKAGQAYRIVLTYRHGTGAALCRLQWSSASTSVEVIEPLRAQGINAEAWVADGWADAARTARWLKGQVDADNWPTGDGELLVQEGGVNIAGGYLLQFHGSARVELHLAGGGFIVDGKNIGAVLAKGTGYDAKTNTTTAAFTATADQRFTLIFSHTSRDGKEGGSAASSGGTGVTDVHVYKPIARGSATPCAPGTVVYPPIREAFSHYTAIRWMSQACNRQHGGWSDRTRPNDMRFIHGGTFQSFAGGECWEDQVMLANETGKDLYINPPVEADDAYFHKLALLLKYGSDGNEPYTTVHAHPVYPPLDPNLNVYVEVGNEIWNWGFGSTQDAVKMAADEIKQNTPGAKIFNYDGHGNYRTWHAWRTVVTSNIFRSVFGDDAMGKRVRMLLEYQYDNAQQTALQSFRFLDGYYNNGTGDHVTDPHPVNYYIWGGGGATYYGVGNPLGLQDQIRFEDASFEQPAIAGNTKQLAPAGSPWHFSGAAGVYSADSRLVSNFQPGKIQAYDATTPVGVRFRVGDKPIFVHTLGCWMDLSWEMSPSTIVLRRVSDGQIVATATIERKRSRVKHVGIVDAPAKSATGDRSIQLQPGVEYDLLAVTNGNPDNRYDAATQITASQGITILGPVQAKVAHKVDKPEQWTASFTAQPGHAFGPVDIQYTFDANPTPLDLPEPSDGAQAAYLTGPGEISQSVNFTQAGDYALLFNAAGPGKPWPGYLKFNIYCDDQSAGPVRQNSDEISPNSADLGGFGRDIGSLHEEWGSAVFHIKEPGKHTLRFVVAAADLRNAGNFIVIDQVRITSVDALINSGFGAGEALGQVVQNKYAAQLNHQAQYAQAFGLHVVAYEAGWSVGGDFGSVPLQTYAKFDDPRAAAINNEAGRLFADSGGFMNVWGVYTYWPNYDIGGAINHPLMKSIRTLADTLAAPANNGIALPAKLTADNAMRWIWEGQHVGDQLPQRGDWLSWVISTPEATACRLQVRTAGDGRYDMLVDGRIATSSQPVGTGSPITVQLSPGSHGILVRNAGGGSLNVASVAVEKQ